MVAVNGMLATNALDNTDNHTTIMKVNQGSPFVILIARFDRYAINCYDNYCPKMSNGSSMNYFEGENYIHA